VRAPEFWDREPGAAARLLAPLAGLYAFGQNLRRGWTTPRKVNVPVICVGNLVAGGAGKTPVALAVGGRLAALGHAVHFLSRGYGGRARGPVRVDPARHSAEDVGDEPLLLARRAPTWVARDRVAAAAAAVAGGASVVVMDDGHQNPTLEKDLSLLVIDGAYGVGNGRVMPAGPLREPPEDGLGRADALVVVGGAGHSTEAVLTFWGNRPVLWAELVPTREGRNLAGHTVLAFAGIARPEKFFATLENLGCRVVAARPFPDHHRYDADEIMTLVESASTHNARLVTTEKDLARLPPEARPMVEALPVSLEFQDEDTLERLLSSVLAGG
jgi:tetraacyldisaccharide 4'-kinase